MPLSMLPGEVGHLDTTYFTSDTTAAGIPARVEWTDWSTRTQKVKSVQVGLDGTGHLARTGLGSKGFVTLAFEWCPAALYAALRAMAADDAHHTLTVVHNQLGSRVLDTEVLDVIAPADEQWAAGDPVEKTTLRLYSHGAV